MREQTITLKNRLSELEPVASALAEFAEREWLSAKVAFDVGLAVDEILTNVIHYAYEDAGGREITVRLICDDAELTLEIQDDGRAFNPLEIPAPDIVSPLADRPVGGLGMHLVRSVMDDMQYRRAGGKNVLRMTKQLFPPGPPAEPASPDLRISQTRGDDGIVVLEVAGRLHGRNADALEEKLGAAIAAGDRRFVLDLARLDYLSSPGLRVLLVTAKRLRGSGELALASPKDFIRAILDVAGVTSLMTIHRDRTAAIAHLRKTHP